MRITGVETVIVAVPRREVATTSGRVSSYQLGVLVKVFTDEGWVGLGEAPDPAGAEVTKTIIDATEPLLVGEDPTNVEVLKKKLYAHYNLTHFHIHAACWALNGIDMALWDLVGRSCQKPLYQIWGGAFRKEIEYYGRVPVACPEEVGDRAAELAGEGFKTIYLKVGLDEEEDLARVRAIREAIGPKLKIRVDPNQSWQPHDAVRILRRMGEYGLEFVEQPVHMYNLDALTRVRQGVNVPIAAHESSWTMYDAVNVIKQGAADAIHVDPRFDAGFVGARITAGMAEAAGLPVIMHSFSELGVAQCAYMHLIASTPNFTLANQSGYRELADDVIKGGLMSFRDGCMTLPEKPGIGVELDQEKVNHYARYYQEHVKGQEAPDPWSSPQHKLMQYRRFFGY
ncbi:MAG: mandelate racemase/muconate lactonizing enzyme family protein [Anaerolineae bacterium]|nr:mandelate racemase/muconate lactonizing enzyme family protein [Anaerolineae bacterium]